MSERAGKTGASWINKDSIFRSTSRSPITKHFQSYDQQNDSLLEQTIPALNVTNQSQFGFHEKQMHVNSS